MAEQYVESGPVAGGLVGEPPGKIRTDRGAGDRRGGGIEEGAQLRDERSECCIRVGHRGPGLHVELDGVEVGRRQRILRPLRRQGGLGCPRRVAAERGDGCHAGGVERIHGLWQPGREGTLVRRPRHREVDGAQPVVAGERSQGVRLELRLPEAARIRCGVDGVSPRPHPGERRRRGAVRTDVHGARRRRGEDRPREQEAGDGSR